MTTMLEPAMTERATPGDEAESLPVWLRWLEVLGSCAAPMLGVPLLPPGVDW
jgi:hypothetical protein